MLLYTRAFYCIEMCMSCIFFAYVYHVGALWHQMAITFSCSRESVLYRTLGYIGCLIGMLTSTISLPYFQFVHEYFLPRLYFLPKIVPNVVFCVYYITQARL